MAKNGITAPVNAPTGPTLRPVGPRLQGKGQHQHAARARDQQRDGPFHLAIDAIDHVPRLQVAGAHVKEQLRKLQIECRNYAHEHGIDGPVDREWKWPL